MPSCIIKSCSSTWRTRTDEMILHTFPRNRDRIRKWLEQLNVAKEDLEYFLERIATSGKGTHRICSYHFKDADYEVRGTNKVLKSTAYPTLNLENILERSILICTSNRADIEHDYYKRQRTEPAPTSRESSTKPSETSSDSTFSFIETSSTTNHFLQCPVSQTPKCDLEETQYVDCILDKSSASGGLPTEPSSDIPISHSQIRKSKYCTICSHGLALPRKANVKKMHRSTQCNEKNDVHNKKIQAAISKAKVSIGTQCSLVDLPPLSLLPAIDSSCVKNKASATSTEDSVHSSLVQNLSPEPTRKPHAIKEERQFNLEHQEEELYVNCADPDLSFVYLPPDRELSNVTKEKKFLVFEKCLDQLLMSSRCMHDTQCNGHITGLRKYMVGSALVVYAECSSKHKFKLWTSQPFIGHLPVGNLLISAAILCSGSSFFKMLNFFSLLEMAAISTTTHCNNQKNYLFPTIEHHWNSQRTEVLKQIGQKGVALLGDGQCDSPGFSAKYCTYSLLDAESHRILDFQVKQLQAGQSSDSLESLAFVEALDRILSSRVRVKVIATDSHVSIRKTIKGRYPDIKHAFDVWHMAKSVGAKLLAASKKRNCRELYGWVTLAKNHLWWASSTCQYNPILLKEKWLSIVYHSANVHEWTGNTMYHHCSHPPVPNDEAKEYEWLTPGSAAHHQLKFIVQDSRLLKDLDHLSIFPHTEEIEVFHSIAIKYCSERHTFLMDAMVARTQLAAIDHNQNISRFQAVIPKPRATADSEGNLHYHYNFSKAKKDWVVSKIYRPTSQVFMNKIISDAVDFAAGLKKFPWKSRQDNPNEKIALVSRPQKVMT